MGKLLLARSFKCGTGPDNGDSRAGRRRGRVADGESRGGSFEQRLGDEQTKA